MERTQRDGEGGWSPPKSGCRGEEQRTTGMNIKRGQKRRAATNNCGRVEKKVF